jgi:hypothetical protein
MAGKLTYLAVIYLIMWLSTFAIQNATIIFGVSALGVALIVIFAIRIDENSDMNLAAQTQLENLRKELDLEIAIAEKVSSGRTREQAITELFEEKQKK